MKFISFLIVSIAMFESSFLYCSNLRIIAGSSNPELAQQVSRRLNIPLSPIKVERFNDGEVNIQIQESVRNYDVYVLQSTCPCCTSSVNDNIMELFLLIRALKRASANTVTAVIPYFGYARQDRKTKSRVPISASDVSMLLEQAGADHVMSVDFHCGQIQGFFHEASVDNLFASKIFVPYVAKQKLKNPVVISPDAGGVERAKYFKDGLKAHGIDTNFAIIVKERLKAGEIKGMTLVGDVNGSDVIIVDDICDTASTLCKAAEELKNHGARKVIACITHPVFSGSAVERISNSAIDELIVSDTVPFRNSVPMNVTSLSIAPLLAEAIIRTHQGKSISHLFDDYRANRSDTSF